MPKLGSKSLEVSVLSKNCDFHQPGWSDMNGADIVIGKDKGIFYPKQAMDFVHFQSTFQIHLWGQKKRNNIQQSG